MPSCVTASRIFALKQRKYMCGVPLRLVPIHFRAGMAFGHCQDAYI